MNSKLRRNGSAHALTLIVLVVSLMLCGWITDRATSPAAHAHAAEHSCETAGGTASPCIRASRSALGANLLRNVITKDGHRLEHWTYACATQHSVNEGREIVSPPDIPWMVLQWLPYCGPGANCGPIIPALNTTTSPYSLPAGFMSAPGPVNAQSIPNPNFPSANPNHANTTRHWATTPTFRVPVPCNQAVAASTLINAITATYSWAQFAQEIGVVIRRFTNTPTADIRANTLVLYDDTPPAGSPVGWATTLYSAPGSPPGTGWDPMPPFVASQPAAAAGVAGVTIWSMAESGPTGDGINDIIMLRNRTLGAIGGLASMLVDPATGQIIECDVIFDAGYFAGLAPADTTAFFHEIGHAFGLDHTNLHPGGYPLGAFTLNPAPSAAMGTLYPGSRSWFQFASTNLAPPPALVSTPASSYPGMTSGITRFPSGANYIATDATPLHPDDATELSRIYPVAAPYTDATGVARDPLINTTATMRGYIRQNNSAPDSLRNVIPMLHKNTNDPTAIFPPPSNILTVPVVGTVSGLARHIDEDVVGMTDTGAAQRGSAAYDLIGIPAAASLTPMAALPALPGDRVDLVVESMPYLGIDPWPAPALLIPAVAGPSEWFYEALLNWTTANEAPRLPVQHVLKDNETPFANGTPRFVGSLAVVPGTILDVNATDPGSQGLAGVTLERVTRPLVEIVERVRPLGAITVNIYHNFPLQNTTILINGVPLTAVMTAVPLAANITRFTIPSGNLPAGPARVVVTAIERAVPGTGVTFVSGRGEVQY